MNTAANIEQYTTNTPNIHGVKVPRGYNVSDYIDRCRWSRRTVYHVINGTGFDGQVSEETRREIAIDIAEDIRQWEESAPAA